MGIKTTITPSQLPQKYQLLYYTTTRFIAGRDYIELLARLEFL